MQKREIAGYPGYYVYEDGRIQNRKRGTFLKQGKHKNGYRLVSLYHLGTPKGFIVHRLVAQAFIPNPDGKPQVNHKDGNKENNHASNLEWMTASENQRHASAMGLMPKGEKHHQAKLTEANVIDIRTRYTKGGTSHRALAAEFGVSRKTVSNVLKFAVWTHLDAA